MSFLLFLDEKKEQEKSKLINNVTNAFYHYAQLLIRELRRDWAVIVPGCLFFGSFFGQAKKEQQD